MNSFIIIFGSSCACMSDYFLEVYIEPFPEIANAQSWITFLGPVPADAVEPSTDGPGHRLALRHQQEPAAQRLHRVRNAETHHRFLVSRKLTILFSILWNVAPI